MALLGGIRLADNFSATKMPQGAASAWAALDGLEFTGAGYKPLLYVGNQLVNGTNYWFIAEQSIYYSEVERHIVKLAVREFKQKIDSKDDEFETVYKLVPHSITILFLNTGA